MQLWLLIGAAAIVAVAGAWWLLGSRDDAMARRDLPGFGQVDVPRRLEGRQPDVSARIAVFRFDLIAGGFAFMGSITPVRERLVIVAWDRAAGDRVGAIGEARDLVTERVEGLRWRVEGNVERGEGTYVVNTRERPSRLTLLVVEAEAIVIAHRIWVEDSRPDESVELVRRIAGSFRRDPQRAPSSR
ncbi:MAG: hypothetical protein AB7O88_22715 [Reyranellaceae bacterium]